MPGTDAGNGDGWSGARDGAAVLELDPHAVADDLRDLAVNEERCPFLGGLLDSGSAAARTAFDLTGIGNVATFGDLREVFQNNHDPFMTQE